jgi:hypothetical protein
MNVAMKVFGQLKSSALIRWGAVLMAVAAIAVIGLILSPKWRTGLMQPALAAVQSATPDVADTQPVVEDGFAPMKTPTIKLNPGATMGVTNKGQLGMLSGSGTFYFRLCGEEVTGDVTIDGNGEYLYKIAANWTAACDQSDGDRSWNAGAIWGITHNGHGIGVLTGKGKFDRFDACTQFKGEVKADGHGGYIYDTAANWTATCGYPEEGKEWNPGNIIGITHNGHSIGVISGSGKLQFDDFIGSGARVTGDVTADGRGGFTYSNVKSATTAGDYWDGVRLWKPGAVLGVLDNGKSIGVLSGTGKLDYIASGAHVTGDVAADGKGGLVYSNVTNGTTTSEYWDGAKLWKPGAVLGVKGKGIEVIGGTGKLDYMASGAHVTGDVTADGKGGFIYKNVTNGATTSEFWDGVTLWKPGAVLGATNGGRGIGVISGTPKVD